MKEYPILFSTEMVQAILEGRKTQTRRIIKPQPDSFIVGKYGGHGVPIKKTNKKPAPSLAIWETEDGTKFEGIKCPYGQEGDVLWVRETWAPNPQYNPPYEFSSGQFLYRADGAIEGAWKPSIHLPKAASRIKLDVISVRVERLQDITEEDAIQEGILDMYAGKGIAGNAWFRYDVTKKEALAPGGHWEHVANDPIDSYASLWKSINGKDSWDEDPYVWVVEFKKV